MQLMPLGSLGAVENNGAVTFGLWLPWVSATDGNAVTIKIIHEADQFLQAVPPREFALAHSVRPPYGDFWSGTVPMTDGRGELAVPANAHVLIDPANKLLRRMERIDGPRPVA